MPPPTPAPFTIDELARRLDDPALVVVDVMPTPGFRAGHVPGARSLPLEELEARAAQVLPDPSAELAVLCANET